MAGYTETHIKKMDAWVSSRLEQRAARAGEPTPATADILAGADPAAAAIARRSMGGRFSLTWNDVTRDYTLIGPQTPLMPVFNWRDDQLDRLLRASAWSWAAVNGNCKAMSQLPPIVQERKGGTWQIAPDNHPLWKFTRAPLGTDPKTPRWSWSKLWYVTGLHYYSAGNGFWVPAESANQLLIYPILTPHLVTADESKITKFPTLYKVNTRYGGELKWTPDKIVNIQAPGSGSYWRGSAPMQAALSSVEIDHVATERQRYSLRNQAAPGLTVMSTKPMGNTPAQRKIVHDEIMDGFVEMTDTGKPWIIGEASKVERGLSPEELQVFDTKKSSQAEIIAVIGMQPSVMGQLDSATYSNTKEATLLWWFGNLNPVLGLMLGDINTQLVEPRYPDARIWYQLAGTNIGLQLLLAQLDAAEKLSRLGLATWDIGKMLEIDIPERDYLKVPVSSWITAGRVEPERIAEVIEELQKITEVTE